MAFLAVFRSRRMLVLFLLGFASGLPLMLTSQTLQAWLTAEEVPLGRIAVMSSVGLAYTFKFAWAPLLDRFRLPVLGRRRGWILAFQLGLVAAIAAMSRVDPARDATAVAVVAVAIAVLSASQDIVVDAYMTDVLAPHERAAGSSVNLIGYRIAMLTSTSLAFVMADHIAWPAIWLTLAGVMALGVVGTALAEEPGRDAAPPRSLAQSVVLPVVDLWRRYRAGALVVLGFTAVYRFGDFFSQTLVIAFLRRGVGFEFTEIAVVYKLIGFVSVVVGGALGGALVARYGMRRMLIGFGALSLVTHLLYVWLAVAGKSMVVLCIAVTSDNTANAMLAVAFVGFLMSLCSPAVSATQFALLTSLSSVGNRVFGPLAGGVVAAIGWSGFFAVCAALVLPGIALAGWASRVAEGDARGELR